MFWEKIMKKSIFLFKILYYCLNMIPTNFEISGIFSKYFKFLQFFQKNLYFFKVSVGLKPSWAFLLVSRTI